MTETYFTVRRETAHCFVDYPQKFRARTEAETYMDGLKQYSVGGAFSVVEHQKIKKPTFRF